MKKFFAIFIFILFHTISFARAEINPIDVTRNAQNHNRQGVEYVQSGNYYSAIKEFELAIELNPKKQTSAANYNNLGIAYLKMFKERKCGMKCLKYSQYYFERAISLDCMQLNYYQNLVDTFELQGILSSELKKYQKKTSENPFSEIVVGLIYARMGKTRLSQITFDNFTASYPNLLVTPSILNFVKTLK